MNAPIVGDCPLCLEHTLQVTYEVEKLMQCLHCGYASADKYSLDENGIESNEAYKQLTEEMKGWSKTAMNRIWIPSILTLPTAMIFPVNAQEEMKWSYAELVDVNEDEREDYRNPEGGYYTQRYDTDNAEMFDEFYLCLFMLTKGKDGKKKIQSRIKNSRNSTRQD